MNATETIQTIDTTALFRAAYENRYTWDANFPGFTAIAQSSQGEVTHRANVLVAPNLKITITEASSDEAEKLIYGQIQEIVIHRVRRSFDQVHGKNTFTDGGTAEDGTVTVLVGGGSAGDRYKVRDNVVTMVHRHIHGTVVTINVASTLDTGEGYLPIDYDSVYANPTTGEVSGPAQAQHDEYERFGQYFMLTLRRLSTVGSTELSQVQEFRLTDIALLESNTPNS